MQDKNVVNFSEFLDVLLQRTPIEMCIQGITLPLQLRKDLLFPLMGIKVIYVESRSFVSEKAIENLRISNRNFIFAPSTELAFHIVGKPAQPMALEVGSTDRACKELKQQQ